MPSLLVRRPLFHASPVSHLATRGFTLVELVTVMILIGIFAVVAVPRFASPGDFDALGSRQQMMQSLRLAQKTAIAKRRLVCVSIAGNTLTLMFATAYGASACDQAVLDSTTGSAYSQSTKNGIGISAIAFNYDPLGRPSFAATQTLNVTGGSATQTITIEAETGYVR